MRIFTLAVLPAHPPQMPVITKNMAMHIWEDLPFQDGPQVLPVPKGQGG